jgi:hypothetical protein
MLRIKQMNIETINKVKDFLTKKGIVFEERPNQCIRVLRDSIVNNIKEEFEEDCYSQLIIFFRQELKLRLYWANKDDDWLWLDSLSETKSENRINRHKELFC